MPLLFQRNDITKMNTEAIVIPANERLMQGSGTSRGIYRAAGEQDLAAACRKIGHCDIGKAVITSGFNLNAKYIIHAVCPRWYGGARNEKELLYSAYAKSLELAAENGIDSISFPLLSAGNYEYPRKEALKVAIHAISDFLTDNDMDVYLLFYDKASLEAGEKFLSVEEYIDDAYVESNDEFYPRMIPGNRFPAAPRLRHEGRRFASTEDAEFEIFGSTMPSAEDAEFEIFGSTMPPTEDAEFEIFGSTMPSRSDGFYNKAEESLDDLLKKVDSPFNLKLKDYAERSGKSNREIYTASNVNKKQYYKLLQDPYITPKKSTVLGLAVGLKLNLDETKKFLASAGYALSPSSGADIIVEHYIKHRKFDCYEINLVLYENGFEDKQIGTAMKSK